MVIKLLFVYGTLTISDNEFAIFLQNNSNQFSKGRFKGRLYDIGDYPGAVEDHTGDFYVHGSIISLHNLAILKHIDRYEGFGTDEAEPNLFIRKIIDVEVDSEIVKCWAYLYNLTLDGLHLVSLGDYLKYQQKIKNPPGLNREG